MQGRLLGVFGSDATQKGNFLSSVAKKSEAEGTIVYHKMEDGVQYSLLDDAQFPDRIQGYSRIASISDYAYYILPRYGKLSAPDGELALLIDSFDMTGKIEVIGEESPPDLNSSFQSTRLEDYPEEARDSHSSVIDLTGIMPGKSSPPSGALVYIDRSFSVKGVEVVVLGFVLSGKVSLHDELRLIPSHDDRKAEVRGIQVSDVEQQSVERGIRVGLSLKGVELKDLAKVAWLDDGSFQLQESLNFEYSQNRFYKQSVNERDLHLQLPGEMLPCNLKNDGTKVTASLPFQVPYWAGMRVSVIDLNGKSLRVAGGGLCS